MVAQKNKDKNQRESEATVVPQTLIGRSWIALRTNAPAIMVLMAVCTIVWHMATTYSRLGSVEEAINGKDGLKEQGKTLLKLETKLDAIEKYLLQPFKTKAALLLGTSDIEIFHSSFLPVSKSMSYKPIQAPKGYGQYSLVYTIKSVKDNVVFIEFQPIYF